MSIYDFEESNEEVANGDSEANVVRCILFHKILTETVFHIYDLNFTYVQIHELCRTMTADW